MPGDSIPAKIEEGLERSRVPVLCMSANAFGSDWAQLKAGTCGRGNCGSGNLLFATRGTRSVRFVSFGFD